MFGLELLEISVKSTSNVCDSAGFFLDHGTIANVIPQTGPNEEYESRILGLHVHYLAKPSSPNGCKYENGVVIIEISLTRDLQQVTFMQTTLLVKLGLNRCHSNLG